MKNRKKTIAASILCLSIFSLFLSGCGKKGDDSTAIAITPTPSDTTIAASETPTASPAASLNGTVSTNTEGTDPSFATSGNMAGNSGMDGNTANGTNKITGTIVAASMDDVTVRTSEGVEYTCSTTNAVNNLASGITLGNNITVTLSSMSAVNGIYTATELNDLSSAQPNPNMGIDNTTGSGTDNSQYSDGTYDYSTDGTYDNGTYDDTATYDDTTYDDGSSYDDGTSYDTGSEDYYYYDTTNDIYNDTTGY